ncbi:glycosyltransferase [Patescibacteria group bacterium]
MRICVITSLYKPYSKGGAERIVETIVDGLLEAGNEVAVITTKPFGRKERISPPIRRAGLYPSLQKGELSVISFYPLNLFWFGNIDKNPMWLRLPWHIIDVFNIYSYFKIKKILKFENPDIVMTHNIKGIGYTAPMAIRSSGIRHIHTVHDVQLVEPSGLLYQENKCDANIRMHTNYTNKVQIILRYIPAKIYELINKKLFGSPDIVISPSEWLINFYIKKGFFKNSKKIVIKNPIQVQIKNNPLFKKCENAPPLYKGGQGGVKNSLKLLYVGQIEKHKGILFLIDVIKKLCNVSLDIVGTGSQLDKIKDVAEGYNNIKIHGFIKNNSLNTFFIQTDFLIVPSICYENAPTVIYESFSNGIPVIASKIGGIPELVKNGYNGYIYEAGNEQSLLDTLQKCADEKWKLDKLKQNALNSVERWGINNYLNILTSEIKRLKD